MNSKLILGLSVASFGFCAPVLAADPAEQPAAESEVTVYADIGVLGLEAREHVFTAPGSNDHNSLLIWQSTAPVLTAGFDVDLPDDWTFAARARVGMGGNSYMEDYDWIPPNANPGDPMNAWSHRSQHPNTELHWYFDGSVAVGKNIVADETTTVNANVGFKYVDVAWTASGGSFIYSDTGYRADVFALPNGLPGVSYRQQLPSAFLGLDAQILQGDWIFDLGAQAGVTFNAYATDRHWLRDLGLEGSIHAAPTVALSAKATYEMNDSVDFYIAGDIEKTFLGYHDQRQLQISTNTLLGVAPIAMGAELLSGSISIGIKGEF